jgi:hypothetical protein
LNIGSIAWQIGGQVKRMKCLKQMFEVGLLKIQILSKGLKETHNYNCTFMIHTLVFAFEGKKKRGGKIIVDKQPLNK